MKKQLKDNLARQLVSIVLLIVVILFIGLGWFLARSLLPLYEQLVYQNLKEPLELVNDEMNSNTMTTDIAYLYVSNKSRLISSDNLSSIINLNAKQVLDRIDSKFGKFSYAGKK